MATTSAGSGPYGFAFNSKDYLIDSEAGSASASSYALTNRGHLTTISSAIPNGIIGATPCWVAITGNGRIAYTGNGGKGISIYAISHDGVLSLVTGEVAVSGAALDLALSRDSEFLYLNQGGQITGFAVSRDGSLTYLSTVMGLPASTTGLAAT
jgi:6-phosphogluconolactonase (cycloisomerase 2 family)